MATSVHFGIHRLDEVVEMVDKAMLLLVDVKLLDVVDHLLFEAVLVVIDGQLLETVEQILTDALGAVLLVRLDLRKQGADVGDLFGEDAIERLAFLHAEIDQLIDSLLNDLDHGVEFLLLDDGSLDVDGIGETQQRLQDEG